MENIDINILNEISMEAGKIIMDIYANEDFSKIVDFKADKSPLTLADRKSNDLIVKCLEKLDKNIPVISEEGKDIPYDIRKNWETFWLVDPLDGTKEFIKKNGEFTVNIALIKNNAPVLGVIYAPALELLYYAQINDGAYKKSGSGIDKITTNQGRTNLIAIGSRSHASVEEQAFLKKYPVTELVSAGSSLKFCLIAEGKADIYYRHNPTMEWDTAAGQVIVECSGGLMTDSNNNKFSYNKTSLVNGSFLCLGNPSNLN